MKKSIFIGLWLISSFYVFGQDIVGDWNGALKIQNMQLRLVFHINKIDNGFTSTMDSPDQGAKGIPMTKVTFENSVLNIEMTAAGINYNGTLDKNAVVTGIFKQGGQSLPLVLTRNAIEKKEIKRPQEPTKPYPYYSEEVTFINVRDTITLAGTLTLPQKIGKFPVAVLISGSGPQNRDEELMGHKPFLVLADYLTRNGIGVLRFDDRGCYASKGNFAKATTQDFATDVEAAVAYLKARKDIDVRHIGLIGHSEGGIIAPLVATKCKDVNFIVLMAGTAVSGGDILLLQQDLIGRAMGIKEPELKQTADINKGLYQLISSIKDTTILKNKLTEYLKINIKKVPNKPKDSNDDDFINQQISQISSPWMLNFIRYNPSPILEKVTCAVLAINGSKDMQVPSLVNLPAIAKALKKANNKQFTTKEMVGLNHLFQDCKTGLPTEYIEIEQTVSPVALAEIGNWIKTVIKK